MQLATRGRRTNAPGGLLGELLANGPSVATADDYRAAVVEDLRDLLGTTRHWSDDDLKGRPDLARSVLNYGIAPLTGRSVGRETADELAREIRTAVTRFEPRIDPATLVTEATVDPDRTPLDALVITIGGRLLGFPEPIPFLVRATANLEAGHFDLVAEEVEP